MTNYATAWGSSQDELRNSIGSSQEELCNCMGSFQDELQNSMGSSQDELRNSMGSAQDELRKSMGSAQHELGFQNYFIPLQTTSQKLDHISIDSTTQSAANACKSKTVCKKHDEVMLNVLGCQLTY